MAKRGRPKLDYKRETFSVSVMPETAAKIRRVTKEMGLSPGRIMDALAQMIPDPALLARAIQYEAMHGVIGPPRPRRQTLPASRLPFGFRRDPETGKLVSATQEIEALRLAGELRTQGMSWHGIAGTLNSRGYLARGRRWYGGSLQRVIRGRQSLDLD